MESFQITSGIALFHSGNKVILNNKCVWILSQKYVFLLVSCFHPLLNFDILYYFGGIPQCDALRKLNYIQHGIFLLT